VEQSVLATVFDTCNYVAGRRELERNRHRWDYNIKVDLNVKGWGSVD
jgi:hypothetical protein